MESVIATLPALVADVGGNVGLAAAAGIALAAVGFGIRYVWRMFKGVSK